MWSACSVKGQEEVVHELARQPLERPLQSQVIAGTRRRFAANAVLSVLCFEMVFGVFPLGEAITNRIALYCWRFGFEMMMMCELLLFTSSLFPRGCPVTVFGVALGLFGGRNFGFGGRCFGFGGRTLCNSGS